MSGGGGSGTAEPRVGDVMRAMRRVFDDARAAWTSHVVVDRNLITAQNPESADAVADWLRRLAGEPAGSRLDRPGMVPGREDVIVGGALVLDAVMTRFDFAECLVSEADILDGLVASQLAG